MNNLKNYVNWKLTHADKTAEAEGYPLVLENCKANKRMKQLEIYGNSFQDGTPTPDAPIEVQSVGELVTDVNDANYGKYKIPLMIKGDGETVSHNIYLNEPLRKIGDYEDYVDFKNKCVVRRNKEVVLKGSDITYRYTAYGDTRGFYIYGNSATCKDAYIDEFYTFNVRTQPEKSTHFIANQSRASNGQYADDWHINNAFGLRFHLAPEAYASDGVASTLADIKAWVQSQYDAGTPLKFIYRLVQPIEETITCELPKLNAKTTIIEVGTSIAPSDAYGKYIKR